METDTAKPLPAQPAEQEKIGRVKGGYLIAAGSFKILEQNKSIMLFPLFSLIINLAIIGIGVAGYCYFTATGAIDPNAAQDSQVTSQNIYYYLGYFLLYIVVVFIASFFHAGMIAMVNAHLKGRKMSFSQGFGIAVKLSGKILCWSVIAATIGVILTIANRFKSISRIIANIFGAAWDIITFFILPVLILEKETVGGSIKRSAAVFKSKWSETIIANFSLGLFFMVAILGVFCMMLVFVFLAQPPVSIMIYSHSVPAVPGRDHYCS